MDSDRVPDPKGLTSNNLYNFTTSPHRVMYLIQSRNHFYGVSHTVPGGRKTVFIP